MPRRAKETKRTRGKKITVEKSPAQKRKEALAVVQTIIARMTPETREILQKKRTRTDGRVIRWKRGGKKPIITLQELKRIVRGKGVSLGLVRRVLEERRIEVVDGKHYRKKKNTEREEKINKAVQITINRIGRGNAGEVNDAVNSISIENAGDISKRRGISLVALEAALLEVGISVEGNRKRYLALKAMQEK